MRQTALIVILAYIGSFVPASHAKIGNFDRIFTRIGASDDLSSGYSTFMVEMTEMANILNQASEHSLVLVDEVGRGTSTYDGLSIAKASAEYIAKKIKALTLFATHYFELTSLAEEIDCVFNVHMKAIEHNQGIVFLHQVCEGALDKSYGIAVAALAGVPNKVLDLAQKNLTAIEKEHKKYFSPQLELELLSNSKQSEILEILEFIDFLDPNNLTPNEALQQIYHLKKLNNEFKKI